MSGPDVAPEAPAWREPWRTGGIITLVRRPRLLWMFTQGELRNRYRGTWLGGLWDYMRPLMRFFVYFFVIGEVLGLSKKVDNFGVYIFSGLIVTQVFAGAITSGTRSLEKHSGLLRRVNVPRETIPLATVVAAFIKQKAALIILAAAALLVGWRPNRLEALPLAVGSVLLLVAFIAGLAMFTSVANMYVRDTQYAVETVVMLTRWATPVMYPWTLVQDRFGEPLTTIYLSNPVTMAMIGIRTAIWEPTVDPAKWSDQLPPVPALPMVLSVVISVVTFALGLWLTRRTEHRVASRISWNS